jgi:hypothetical protein
LHPRAASATYPPSSKLEERDLPVSALVEAGKSLCQQSAVSYLVEATGARQLAAEGVAVGVRVNCVSPGVMATPPVLAMFAEFGENAPVAPILERTIDGKPGDPLAVAYAGLYLASGEAKWVIGSHLVVDSGAHAVMSSLGATNVVMPAPGSGRWHHRYSHRSRRWTNRPDRAGSPRFEAGLRINGQGGRLRRPEVTPRRPRGPGR